MGALVKAVIRAMAKVVAVGAVTRAVWRTLFPAPVAPPPPRPNGRGGPPAEAPRAAWREFALAWIGYLDVQVDAEECRDTGDPRNPERQKLIDGIRRELQSARQAASTRRFRPKSRSLERIWANVRAAEVNLLKIVSEEELRARSGRILAMARMHISCESPQLKRAERVVRKMSKRAAHVGEFERAVLVEALGVSYGALDEEYRRVRKLTTTLWWTLVAAFAAAGLILLLVWQDPGSLNLCFPDTQDPYQAGQGRGDRADTGQRICPTGVENPDEKSQATPADLLAVEAAGLLGSGLTVVAAFHGMRETRDVPYGLPLAAAMLKFPLGAVSAVIGILLIRGGFLPGLSVLDSPQQIVSWAVIFGAAQHVVTHFIDQRAHSTMVRAGDQFGIGPPMEKHRTEGN